MSGTQDTKDEALLADLNRVYSALEQVNFHDENAVIERAIVALGGSVQCTHDDNDGCCGKCGMVYG